MENKRLKQGAKSTVTNATIVIIFCRLANWGLLVDIYLGIVPRATCYKVGNLRDEEFVGSKAAELRVLRYATAPICSLDPVLSAHPDQWFVKDVEKDLTIDRRRGQFESYKLISVGFPGVVEKILLALTGDVFEALFVGGLSDSS